MKYSVVLLIFLFNGCSFRATEFFEDLIADNEVVKSDGQYQKSVEKDSRAPILMDKEQKKRYADMNDNTRKFRGKIAKVHFDRDFNLYVYTFVDNITHKPITFYYDKNIHHNSYKGDYRIEISGNYLIHYTQLNRKVPVKGKSTESNIQKEKTYIIHKRYKRRKRSSIKTPIEEKISPL